MAFSVFHDISVESYSIQTPPGVYSLLARNRPINSQSIVLRKYYSQSVINFKSRKRTLTNCLPPLIRQSIPEINTHTQATTPCQTTDVFTFFYFAKIFSTYIEQIGQITKKTCISKKSYIAPSREGKIKNLLLKSEASEVY